ncbi:hypothetical protein IHE45_14G100600 [Dioscorea alata]|uniref:Uncharacterized protein n=1 Tax=Dioscorea alata TaxID=55571 RepID=A0ACB7UTR9_DIOAL|nr:hypothetical protein IHE45_14G100600 [Dioscorea alata]
MESSDFSVIEERLRVHLRQLQTESGILERIVYKNKNQHRRCPYFKSLLKVRRDVNLLNSAMLGDVLSVLFPIIDGKKPAQKAFFISRVNKNSPCGKYNYLERLLGIARLLSQILLDIVVVFNKVSSLSQKKHDVKLTQEGLEVFREFYPSHVHDQILECVWKEDKFVLIEKKDPSFMKDQSPLPPAQSIQYELMELFDEVQGIEHDPNLEITKNPDAKDLPSPNQEVASDDCSNDAYHVHQELPSIDLAATANASGTISSFSGLKPRQSQNESRKVAFISVGKSAPSVADNCRSNKKMKSEMQPENAAKTDDPFLSLLLAGNTNKSLF